MQLATRRAVLSLARFTVVVATSAPAALSLLRSSSTPVDAIVTDHIMPEESGAEFVRKLRHIEPTVPVIVVSGLAEAEQEYEGMQIHFRMKPCPPEELIALLRSVTHNTARAFSATTED
jgi:DNA-binding response OmpR family regulator